jgi:hypothetical protein
LKSSSPSAIDVKSNGPPPVRVIESGSIAVSMNCELKPVGWVRSGLPGATKNN